MSGRAPSYQTSAVGHLLAGLNAGITDLAATTVNAAAFSKTDLRLNLVPMLIHEILDPDARRSLFTRLGHKDHVPVERYVQTLEHQHDHERGCQVVLIIYGA